MSSSSRAPTRVTFVMATIICSSSPPLFLSPRFWEPRDKPQPGFFLEAREKTLNSLDDYYFITIIAFKQKAIKIKMPRPGFEPGLLRPQRSVLTTRRSRRVTEEVSVNRVTIIGTICHMKSFYNR